MKISMKRAISVVVAIIFISMCCSIKSYAISMNLELSGDNIVFSKGVYVCSKKIPVGGKMNIKAEYVTSNEMSPALQEKYLEKMFQVNVHGKVQMKKLQKFQMV